MKVSKTAKWLTLIGMPALLATVILRAQGQVPAAQQGTVFRATTNYVHTTVLVRDKDGRFIPDLKVNDFKVYEDGVLQQVSLFSPWIGGRPVGSLAVTNTPASSVTEGLILPPSRPSTDASGRIFIVFIDDLHLLPADTPAVKDLLNRIRDTVVHENDLVGFVSTGPSSIEISPTYDFGHRRFNEAIGKVMGAGISPTDILQGAITEGSQGPMQLRHNVHVAFSTVYDMLDQIKSMTDRRKSFLWVSSGYTLDPFTITRYQLIQQAYNDPDAKNADGSDLDENQVNDRKRAMTNPYDPLADESYKKRTEFSESDLDHELAQLTREARRDNVFFYTIDPRGLMGGMDIQLREKLADGDYRTYIQRQGDTLKVIAEETGGFAVVQTNDIDKGLRRIDAETSDYYMIGYISSNPDPLKLRREIKIEVSRPGAELVYRPEYTIPRQKR